MRYLHDHLSSAGSLHLPALAQRIRTADRPRPGGVSPVCRARLRPGPPENDKVVPMPNAEYRSGAAGPPSMSRRPPKRWKGLAAPGICLPRGSMPSWLRTSFDPRHFLTGARSAYEMIVLAYAQGDRRTLKAAVARDL